jgi:hypothetical protein
MSIGYLMIPLFRQFQRFALLAGGRAWTKLREQASVWAQIKPENAAESHPSSARFVGWRFLPLPYGLKHNSLQNYKPSF